ncbi:MAG: multiheme c-type cytochrome [Candidatus Binatia bacterium]
MLLSAHPAAAAPAPPAPLRQTQAEADAKSAGCLSCHAGIEPMHESTAVVIGCADCHGGDAQVNAGGAATGTEAYAAAQRDAHVLPRHPEQWADPNDPARISSANPVRSYTLLNHESPEFIRFVNPGDLRVSELSCGACHTQETHKVERSLMTTSAMLWGGAAYNNGIVSVKNYIFGESYSADGVAQQINTVPTPTAEQLAKGVLPSLVPLPRWNVVQPADPFRAFEKGGKADRSSPAEIANPNVGPFVEEPGKPDMKLSSRGLGTELRVAAGVLNLHKTRLNDPMLSFLGTNDNPGDFRSSGCTACHVVYANDRNPVSAGPYADKGNMGTYHGADPTIRRDESGHPITHRLTRAIPTSQCMICHMHQPNSFVNTYLGFQMWDYETDGDLLWPAHQRFRTEDEPTPFNESDFRAQYDSLIHNPEEAATRGLWTDINFLKEVSRLPAKETTFADYHGHGWVFRSVLSQDKRGNLLDGTGQAVDMLDPDKLRKAVHLMDIHAEKGMHCVDCHFEQDAHGNGKLYGEYPNAVEIQCQDCHGTIDRRAQLRSTGPAAPKGGMDLLTGLTPFRERRFEWVDGELIQRSMMKPELSWKVSQVLDSIDPTHPEYNPKARLAKTIQRDGTTWGALPASKDALAHRETEMACYTCHTSWVTSCFGCHLPQQANWKKTQNHFEGGESRNWTSYNPQVLRQDIFMLGKHMTTKNHIVAPVRSSSALVLSSVSANRERLYGQQAPVSAEGFSSQAFNAHFPHTVRKLETRGCADCHVSSADDNNAWMAQVLTLGTNFVNFIGRYAWVGEGSDGIEAVAVTEWDEPQAVIGSNLHKLAYPANFARHLDAGTALREAYHHGAGDGFTDLFRRPEVLSLQLRGEYLYAATGSGGLRVFDVANLDNKSFSERVISAPVSPLGQRAYVRTAYATGVALPTNQPINYGRTRNPANQEQVMHPLYRYAYVSDREEGLVVVDVDMLTDGDPQNNFLERVATFNPGGVLDGARFLTVAGTAVYVLCDRGLVVVSIDDPLDPRVIAELGAPALIDPRAITVQFRYAFATDAEGLKVIDVTAPAAPRLAATLPLAEAGDLYVARTYAYVPIGSQGLAIVDVERPTQPVLYTTYSAEGAMNDTRSVRVGATYGAAFAYVADGANGLRVLQLIAPNENPYSTGFSPPPMPRLIATHKTDGPALTLSKGMDRDRAVDESGNQIAVWGRLGSRPFNRAEMEELFLRDGKLFTVAAAPPGKPADFVRPYEPGASYGIIFGPPVQPLAPKPERLLPGRQ